MNLYCIHHIRKGTFDAASKAPEDVFQIAQKCKGAKEIVFYEPKITANRIRTSISALLTGIGNWLRLYMLVPQGAYVLLQHPLEGIQVSRYMLGICKAKGIRFIGFIHDLDSLRGNLAGKENAKRMRRSQLADSVLLKKCDYLICLNDKMKEYMVSHGFAEGQCVSMGIWDYLLDDIPAHNRERKAEVVIAGNLMPGKCGYLYQLADKNDTGVLFHIYGAHFHEDISSRNDLVYHGSFPPDVLPLKLDGSFGLVWDGDSIDSCSGNAGEYLRYNNPHKTSLFLASEMPVIIWREAALADFVVGNNVGIAANSISEIKALIDNMTDDEYMQIQENVRMIGRKLRKGNFLAEAITRVEERVE